MDRRLMYVSLAFAAAFLYFVAIAYDGWRCNGSIFSADCLRLPHYQAIGALHVTAALIVLTAGILLILLIVFGYSWGSLAACVLSGVSFIFSMVGIIYYANLNRIWSPTLATVAMTLSAVLMGNLFFDLIDKE
ncbi:hypothetical protein TcWFU_001170 [Taenia crassiceps]|uniref:Uncharacterized protein n=1 Tax=Taenia crassiceps TaxID=6207 RepID=A0ABR4Q7K4_9CEST